MTYVLPAAEDYRYIALRKNNEDGSQTIFTGYFIKTPGSWESKYSKNGDVVARIDVLKTKPLTKRLVTVKAEEITQQLNTSGRIALYGIQFDFNKADIKPESTESLTEIGKFLTSNPTVKIIITGHTDSVGDFEFNRSLSEKRASSVLDYLASKYQVSKDRLLSFGASFSSPIASNTTEEGKAKNRRVEIVQF